MGIEFGSGTLFDLVLFADRTYYAETKSNRSGLWESDKN